MAIYKLENFLKLNNYKNNRENNISKFIDATNINDLNYYILSDQIHTIAPSHSIIFIKDGSVGKINYINEDLAIGSTLISFYSTNDIAITKYIYYWFLINKNIILQLSKGSVIQHIYFNDLCNLFINIPDIKIQKQIIDIIEPIELLKNNISNMIKKIKNALIFQYKQIKSKTNLFINYVTLNIEKRKNEIEYFATNAFGELNLDYSKNNIINDSNAPSRANLKPQANSIIFSKLNGENKLYYFKDKPNFIISTGFYNITTEYVDLILGFLLSNDFKTQKTLFATGTTMIGINSEDLSKIKIKELNNKSNDLAVLLSYIFDIKKSLDKIQDKYMNLLIK